MIEKYKRLAAHVDTPESSLAFDMVFLMVHVLLFLVFFFVTVVVLCSVPTVVWYILGGILLGWLAKFLWPHLKAVLLEIKNV